MVNRPVMMAETEDGFWLLSKAEYGFGFLETAYTRSKFPDSLAVLGSHLRGEAGFEFQERFASVERWEETFNKMREVRIWSIDL